MGSTFNIDDDKLESKPVKRFTPRKVPPKRVMAAPRPMVAPSGRTLAMMGVVSLTWEPF